MNDKIEGTLSLNKEKTDLAITDDETKELEQERDTLKTQLEDIEKLKSSPDDSIKTEVKESPLAVAARKGRERSDPRFIEAAKRDPNMLDMGSDFDLKMTIHDSTGQLDGYHVHWIVDKPGKIPRLLAQGYEPIYKDGIKVGDGPDDFNEDMDTWVSMITGTLEGGGPQVCYALKMDQELYDLRKAKQRKERVTDVEDQIMSGHFEEKDDDNRYVDKSRTKFDFAR